jgi:NAD(P)-dependent dehydrogenase (short-subunit alcohol dehydrogenase family)
MMQMKKNLLIAGAGAGIGLALAKHLQQEYELIVVNRSDNESFQALTGKKVITDCTNQLAVQQIPLPESLAGVVYCPGSITLKPFQRLTQADMESDMNQNVWGAVYLLQHCLNALKRQNNSSVVLFSTVAVQTGLTFHSSIAMAKGSVEGLVRSLAAEWVGAGIRVNAIAPSLTDTKLSTGLLNTPEKKAAAEKRHPLAKIGTPESIAALAAFLLSENADWITGQILHADGGLSSLR